MDTLSTNSFPWFLCVQKEVSEVVVVTMVPWAVVDLVSVLFCSVLVG